MSVELWHDHECVFNRQNRFSSECQNKFPDPFPRSPDFCAIINPPYYPSLAWHALAWHGMLCWQASTQASMKLGESLPSRQYLGNSRAYWQHTNALRCKVYICSSHHQIVIWIWFWFWDLLAKPNQYTNRQCCLSFHYKKKLMAFFWLGWSILVEDPCL